MDSLKTASLVILSILAPLRASVGLQHIVTQAGGDCDLQCQGPGAGEVQLLELSRVDLELNGFVLLYRDKRVLDDYQHPRFSNRVQLRDPQLKTGDLSVVLKRVTPEDSGTYRCFALFETSGGIQEISQDTELTVTETEALDNRATEGEAKSGRVMSLRAATGSYRVTPGHAVGVIVMVIAQSLLF